MVSPVEALCGQITVWRMRGRERVQRRRRQMIKLHTKYLSFVRQGMQSRAHTGHVEGDKVPSEVAWV